MTDVVFCGQLAVNDISSLHATNIRWIVNHRPDFEEPGQPTSDEIAAAAGVSGVNYVHIPVRGLPDPDSVARTAEVLAAMRPGDKAVFFCRSGMRSAAAWAMAEATRGANPDALRATALQAGYDLSRVQL